MLKIKEKKIIFFFIKLKIRKYVSIEYIYIIYE